MARDEAGPAAGCGALQNGTTEAKRMYARLGTRGDPVASRNCSGRLRLSRDPAGDASGEHARCRILPTSRLLSNPELREVRRRTRGCNCNLPSRPGQVGLGLIPTNAKRVS